MIDYNGKISIDQYQAAHRGDRVLALTPGADIWESGQVIGLMAIGNHRGGDMSWSYQVRLTRKRNGHQDIIVCVNYNEIKLIN